GRSGLSKKNAEEAHVSRSTFSRSTAPSVIDKQHRQQNWPRATGGGRKAVVVLLTLPSDVRGVGSCGNGGGEGELFLDVGPGDRLPARPQHADRRGVIHAADHLRVCHLARHARLHYWRLIEQRHAGAARRTVHFERCPRYRGRGGADVSDVAHAAGDVWCRPEPPRALHYVSTLRLS